MTTSYSPIFGSAYAPINNNYSGRKRIARLLNNRGARKDRELVRTLLGVIAGSTATKSYVRVTHPFGPSSNLGGVRPVETINLVNRATTAGDVTDLAANLFAFDSKPNATSYPRNLALNH
jgi:hypothetical protein